jgi:hypothetical protein
MSEPGGAQFRAPGEGSVEADNSRALEDAKARHRRYRDAFLQTFGPRDNRTPLGKIMMERLEAFCGRSRPRNILDDHGRTDIWQTARALGWNDVLREINDLIEWKE